MSIWFTTDATADALNASSVDTLVKTLGIEYTERGDDFLTARMPVDERTRQPAGILHGGASVVLAETLGSVSSYLCLDPEKKYAVGMEVNANHVRPVSDGFVYGTARPIHLGRTSHIWDIRIVNDDGKLICIARLTMAVLDLPGV